MVLKENPTRLLRRLAWTGAGLAFGLIVLGGVVRITGSGMGCGDHWPRCNGEWFPPLDLPTLIEIGHRWAAALVSILVFAIAAVAWTRHRGNRRLRNPATLVLVLLVAQVLLGAVTVKLALPPWVVITHLANAMFLLAAIIVTALRAGAPATTGMAAQGALPDSRAERAPAPHPGHPLVLGTAVLGLVVILFGAQVANFHAGLLCLGFPLCSGAVLPPASALAFLPWAHRALAFGFLGLVVVLAIRLSRRSDPASRSLRRSVAVVVALTVLQVGIAAAMVLELLPPTLRAMHLLVGTLVWAALVVLVFHSTRTPAVPVDSLETAPARPSVLADLVTLTKPRIISLLLVTTVAPMFITPAGLPTVGQVFWVILGGYLMAGGANAINMWFDRDIDDKMTRTRLRPIPAGRIPATLGLAFGISLGLVAFGIFWYRVNPLSAWLALGGLLFYVFVYTIWLKRTSPQNIVIGGAAGAFPPLVGWAAMTGSLDLAAVYLFAIIFYWTPPHFWALALIKQGEYARAGVPMMPVVRGEQRTKFEMLAYTLILLPLTLMPAFFGAMGTFYGVAAALLGARLLWYSIQLLRERSSTPLAWRMYRYSLLYLALLFVAMGVDRALPFGHRPQPEPVLILSQPEQDLATPTGGHQGH
ncbi:MAG TPA: heme o synthase [Gemmatimonadales bacterium]|nr:heme o synthase [Gemmatimonadales bacterium]